MHELSIACDLVHQVCNALKQYPGSKVETITVAVGVYSGVDPEALRTAFPFAAEGTSVRDAGLVITAVEPSFTCHSCGASYREAGGTACPVCGSTDMELIAGRELEITAVELLPGEDEKQSAVNHEDMHDTGCLKKQGA
jgi:hydrogenase nickel incorporation protein HypA/HybF